MIINIIVPGIGLSGGMRVLFQYGELLKAKGHDVVFYTPLKAYDVQNSKSLILNKAHVVTNTIKRIYSYEIKKKYKNLQFDVKVLPVPFVSDRYIRNADICMASAWPTAFSVARLSPNKGKKVYFIQDYEIWNNEELGRKSYTQPLRHVVISTWIKNKLIDQLGEEDAPIVFDGLDLEVFNNPEKKYDFGDRTIEVLMLYHNLPKKGVKDGLIAYKNVKSRYPNVKLTMFGLADRPDISDEIMYYKDPSREKLKELYKKTDIFLYTSREEGWGLTPLEAMASKCAVVGTNTGCMLDIGSDRENALLCEPGDVRKMTKNLCELLENHEMIIKLAENGYKTVQQFSWENSVEQLERELRIICNEDKN